MTTVYAFIPTKMTCYTSDNGKQDVVFNIDWRFHATDGKYGYLTQGSCTTNYVSGNLFTPYSQLTEQQVVSWIEESLGLDTLYNMRAQADAAIAAQYGPTITTPPLPWDYRSNGKQILV